MLPGSKILKFILESLSKIERLGSDFSDQGFILQDVSTNPDKIFSVVSMWIGKMGWGQGIKKNIVRCYPDGFSFWHGHERDNQEWYCSFDRIEGFKQPLKIGFADPIITIRTNNGKVDCMFGAASNHIKALLGDRRIKTAKYMKKGEQVGDGDAEEAV